MVRRWCYPGEGFDPLATLQTVAEERCTSLYGVPTMFIAELDHPEFAKFDLSSLRTGMMAGSPCPIEVMRRCIRDMHLTRDDHRLRHDGDQPGQHPDGAGRSAGAARIDGGARASARGGQDHRYRGPHRAARHARRVLHPRLFGDAGLLGRCGAHRAGDRRGGLDAHRRSGDDGRGRAIATSSAASRTW